MKRMAALLLAALFVASLGLAVAARAEDRTPAKNDGGGKAGGSDAGKDKSGAAKSDEAAKPAAATPYEKQMAEIQKLVDAADKLKEKLFDVETKVTDEVGKLKEKDGKTSADPAKLKEELAKNQPSANARKYRDLIMQLAKYEETIISKQHDALGQCKELPAMKAPNDDTKSKGEALAVSVKEAYVDMLLKVASVYERVVDEVAVAGTYKRVLAVDKTNETALNYFKEQDKKKKETPKSSGTSAASKRGGGVPKPH